MALCICCGETACLNYRVNVCVVGTCCRTEDCLYKLNLACDYNTIVTITGPDDFSSWYRTYDPYYGCSSCGGFFVPGPGEYSVAVTYKVPIFDYRGAFTGFLDRSMTLPATVVLGACTTTLNFAMPEEMCVNGPFICYCAGVYAAVEVAVGCYHFIGNTAVAGAIVTLDGPCGTFWGVTDADGHAYIAVKADCWSCEYNVTVTHPDYHTETRSKYVRAGCYGPGGPGDGGTVVFDPWWNPGIAMIPKRSYICVWSHGCGCEGGIDSSEVTLTGHGVSKTADLVGCRGATTFAGMTIPNAWACYWCAYFDAPDKTTPLDPSGSIKPSLPHHLTTTFAPSRLYTTNRPCPGTYTPTLPPSGEYRNPATLDSSYVCYNMGKNENQTFQLVPICRNLNITGPGTGTLKVCLHGYDDSYGYEFGHLWTGCATFTGVTAAKHRTVVVNPCAAPCYDNWSIESSTVTAKCAFGIYGAHTSVPDCRSTGIVAPGWVSFLWDTVWPIKCNPMVSGECRCSPCCAPGECPEARPLADDATYTITGPMPCVARSGSVRVIPYCTVDGTCPSVYYLDMYAFGPATMNCNTDTITATVPAGPTPSNCYDPCGHGPNIAAGAWTVTCGGGPVIVPPDGPIVEPVYLDAPPVTPPAVAIAVPRPVLFATQGGVVTDAMALVVIQAVNAGEDVLGVVCGEAVEPGAAVDQLIAAGVLVTSGQDNRDALAAFDPRIIDLDQPNPA